MMDISINILGREKLARWFVQMSRGTISGALTKGMYRAVRLVQTTAKRDYLTGPRPEKLGVVTGRLRSSITVAVRTALVSGAVEGVVGTRLKYARIHEFGGEILPKKGKYLRFQVGGRWVSVKRVYIPPRPYLRTAVRDCLPKIQEILGYEVMSVIES